RTPRHRRPTYRRTSSRSWNLSQTQKEIQLFLMAVSSSPDASPGERSRKNRLSEHTERAFEIIAHRGRRLAFGPFSQFAEPQLGHLRIRQKIYERGIAVRVSQALLPRQRIAFHTRIIFGKISFVAEIFESRPAMPGFVNKRNGREIAFVQHSAIEMDLALTPKHTVVFVIMINGAVAIRAFGIISGNVSER